MFPELPRRLLPAFDRRRHVLAIEKDAVDHVDRAAERIGLAPFPGQARRSGRAGARERPARAEAPAPRDRSSKSPRATRSGALPALQGRRHSRREPRDRESVSSVNGVWALLWMPAFAGMTTLMPASPMPTSPAERITQFDAQAPKIPLIARHQNRAVDQRGRRHQRVGHVQRASFIVGVCAEAAGEARDVEVDRQGARRIRRRRPRKTASAARVAPAAPDQARSSVLRRG